MTAASWSVRDHAAHAGGVTSASHNIVLRDAPDLEELLSAMMAAGKPVRFTARGHSMHPLVRDGDVLTVESPGKALLPVGSIVACHHPRNGTLIIHRIIACDSGARGSTYVVRGDNLPRPDGRIAADRIVGRVICVRRKGRDVRLGVVWGAGMAAHLSRRGLLRRVVAMARSFERVFDGGRA